MIINNLQLKSTTRQQSISVKAKCWRPVNCTNAIHKPSNYMWAVVASNACPPMDMWALWLTREGSHPIDALLVNIYIWTPLCPHSNESLVVEQPLPLNDQDELECPHHGFVFKDCSLLLHINLCMIANTVKWTTHDPCLVLQFVKVIQNYTLPLNFVKKKHRHIDLQCQAIYDDKKNPEKSLHIWEDVARGVQVGDIEQVILYFFYIQ